ncbi:hypothetical protein [Undibacterium baiyunense]|uniref:Uncharacterized protein n=1 Tax=Undibacterium baiyunense TaxID=2828731 RepID=A0A941I2A3_9BURK|nr:hypothetical protein [Undibacterium baiyunense]MBR7746107.1 hypothetical protein [Undibacterium baiyunense]
MTNKKNLAASNKLSRSHLVSRLKSRIEKDGYPRLQMMLMVMMTGLIGFLSSFILLHSGMQTMWLRYLCAFGIAYVGFIGLLRVWLVTQREQVADVTEAVLDIAYHASRPSSGTGSQFSGQGGDFGGGGTSASFDSASSPSEGLIDLSEAGNTASSVSTGGSGGGSSGSSGIGNALSGAGDADELVIPLAVAAFVLALLLSTLYVVYSAPMLLAELSVDFLLATGLYRRLKKIPETAWLGTAIKKTIWPFLITAVVISGSGWVLQNSAPGANTLSEVLKYHEAHQDDK